MEHRRVHRRHALEHGHSVALDDLERVVGVKARDQREHRAGSDGGIQRARLPERVEQRQRAEDDRLGLELEQIDRHLDVSGKIAVSQLGPLRPARGPRRVQDHGRVLARHLDHFGPRLLGTQQPLERAGRHDDRLGIRPPGSVLRRVGESVPGEQQLGPGIGQIELHLARLEQRVHRHDDTSGPEHAVVRDRELRHVGQHDPDPRSAVDAAGAQEPGDPGAGCVERGIRDLGLVELQRDALAMALGRDREVCGKVAHLKVLLVRGDAAQADKRPTRPPWRILRSCLEDATDGLPVG